MESFISGYDYAHDQTCSGQYLGYTTSLISALAKCDKNKECVCIRDQDCDGKYWYMHPGGQSTASDYDCSWTKQGSLIWSFEQRFLMKL